MNSAPLFLSELHFSSSILITIIAFCFKGLTVKIALQQDLQKKTHTWSIRVQMQARPYIDGFHTTTLSLIILFFFFP